MDVIRWLRGQYEVEQHHSYRHDLEFQSDPLNDIGHLDIDYFWCKCEELLPDDWAMGLFASPTSDGLSYEARASLVDPDLEFPHEVRSGRYKNPLRAIEKLFYLLRDGLL